MPGIREAHDYLATSILAPLSITDPVSKSIKKAWKFIPPSRVALADVPCAFSTWGLREVQPKPALLHKLYTIHIQMPVGPVEVDADRQADVASAFFEALVLKLTESPTTMLLGGNIKGFWQNLRGAPDTLAVLEWGGVGYMGLDLFLDVDIDQVPGYSS